MKKFTFPCIFALLSIIALSAGAYPPPADDKMLLTELKQKLFDYDGKIVEVEVTYAYNLQQKSPDEYSVYCYCYSSASYDGGASVSFSNDDDDKALDFFQDLLGKSYGSGLTSFYVLVDGKKYIAVGEKFSKSKGTYKW